MFKQVLNSDFLLSLFFFPLGSSDMVVVCRLRSQPRAVVTLLVRLVAVEVGASPILRQTHDIDVPRISGMVHHRINKNIKNNRTANSAMCDKQLDMPQCQQRITHHTCYRSLTRPLPATHYYIYRSSTLSSFSSSFPPTTHHLISSRAQHTIITIPKLLSISSSRCSRISVHSSSSSRRWHHIPSSA